MEKKNKLNLIKLTMEHSELKKNILKTFLVLICDYCNGRRFCTKQ